MTRRPEDRWTTAQVRDFLDRSTTETIHPTPLADTTDDGTRVLQPTVSEPAAEPVAVPPVSVDPHLAVPPPSTTRRRRSPWPWVAAVAVVLVLGVIAYAAWTMVRDGTTTATSGPERQPSGSESTKGASQTKADTMEQFLDTYLSTVTSDRHRAWDMLTPAYQAASGGFGSYSGFWATIRSATPSNVSADPAAGTVTYDVAYVKANGDRTTEHHTLQLVPDGSSYLINDQLV